MSFLSKLNFFNSNIAIDLGTVNTLIWKKGKIVINEPSIIAFEKSTSRIIAYGNDAKAMLGRSPSNIEIIRPMRDGVIDKPHVVEEMLKTYINKIANSWGHNILVCVPCGAKESDQMIIRDSCERSGAKNVDLLFEPMAAAIGIGLDVLGPEGNMIVDIGGGTAEIAVIAFGGIICHQSITVAGNYLTSAILDFFRREHNLYIGFNDAEKIKHIGGSVYEMDEKFENSGVHGEGKGVVDGIPAEVVASNVEIREKALAKPVQEIINAIRRLLEDTPPELSKDIYKNGLWITGGGALLNGFVDRVKKETRLHAQIPLEESGQPNPLLAVITGAGKVLDNIDKYKSVLVKRTLFNY
jgi:rod shape-determining protein MreB